MEHTSGPLRALTALDDQIRAATGGEPGSGLYGLLNMMAGQFLGVPRSAMPAAPVEAAPAVEATAEPVEEDEETKAGRHGGHRRR